MKGWIEGRKLIVFPLYEKECFFRPRKLSGINWAIFATVKKKSTEWRLTFFPASTSRMRLHGKSRRTKIDKLTFFLCWRCWSCRCVCFMCVRRNHSGDLSLVGASGKKSETRLMATVFLFSWCIKHLMGIVRKLSHVRVGVETRCRASNKHKQLTATCRRSPEKRNGSDVISRNDKIKQALSNLRHPAWWQVVTGVAPTHDDDMKRTSGARSKHFHAKGFSLFYS